LAKFGADHPASFRQKLKGDSLKLLSTKSVGRQSEENKGLTSRRCFQRIVLALKSQVWIVVGFVSSCILVEQCGFNGERRRRSVLFQQFYNFRPAVLGSKRDSRRQGTRWRR
jgi:hypothetical protein